MQAASEDELRLGLGLQNYTSGKGKVELKDSSMRPIEIFMCSVVRLVSPSFIASLKQQLHISVWALSCL